MRAIRSALSLLVSRVFLADDPDHAAAADHPAMLANRLDAAAYLHIDACAGPKKMVNSW
jgi:hypothetical protein